MIEKKHYRTSTEVALIIVLMISLGVHITHEDAVDNIYTCEVTRQDSYCFDVRDYGSKINYRCLYDETNKRKYFSCNSGWEKITLQNALETEFVEQIQASQWLCSPSGCEVLG